MSLHFLLDGYNIIHQMPPSKSTSLEDERARLVRLIEILRPQGSIKNKVTIVFDGRSGFSSQAASALVEVVFSQDRSADDKIKQIVQSSFHKKNIVVVTDDRDIQYAVRSEGAKVLNVQGFLKQLISRPRITRSSPASKRERDVKYISKTQEFEITSEVSRIWLKKEDK